MVVCRRLRWIRTMGCVSVGGRCPPPTMSSICEWFHIQRQRRCWAMAQNQSPRANFMRATCCTCTPVKRITMWFIFYIQSLTACYLFFLTLSALPLHPSSSFCISLVGRCTAVIPGGTGGELPTHVFCRRFCCLFVGGNDKARS